jgi:hypothetical protein
MFFVGFGLWYSLYKNRPTDFTLELALKINMLYHPRLMRELRYISLQKRVPIGKSEK